MRFLRFFLFPFSFLYMLVTSFRNVLFDWGVFKEYAYNVPTIGIGNLSQGGTGKSVAIDYFISQFKKEYALTVLSRGYGRLSKGFQLATQESTANTIGDEPLMFFQKHPTQRIAVCNSRRKGMEILLNTSTSNYPPIYLWDDCFQHRWVKPNLLILLTTYDKPFFKDFVFPVGKLRELSEGASRAKIIIVTKCPKDLTDKQRKDFEEKIQLKSNQHLFFSKIKYASHVQNNQRELSLRLLEKISFVLVTGIADSSPMVRFLKSKFYTFEHMNFSDHHIFTDNDVKKIEEKSNGRMVLTTQKDYVRLSTKFPSELLFFLPIEMEILAGQERELLKLVKHEARIN